MESWAMKWLWIQAEKTEKYNIFFILNGEVKHFDNEHKMKK